MLSSNGSHRPGNALGLFGQWRGGGRMMMTLAERIATVAAAAACGPVANG